MNLTRYYTLDEIPVFAKSGTIMPMRGKITTLLGQAQKEYTDLHFKVFLGSVQGGYFNLYEDEGNNIDYISGASASKCRSTVLLES
jgi:alpha-glucosidase (family GH31 glycosyl hydrolase)